MGQIGLFEIAHDEANVGLHNSAWNLHSRTKIPVTAVFTHLNRWLPFLAMGLFWGVVAGVLHIFNYGVLFSQGRVWQVNWTLIWSGLNDWTLVGPAVGAFMIATVLSNAMLKRELTAFTWAVNWAITAVVSCVGGLGLFQYCLMLALSLTLRLPRQEPGPTTWIEPIVNADLIAAPDPGPLMMSGPVATVYLIAMITGIAIIMRTTRSIRLLGARLSQSTTSCVGTIAVVVLASCLFFLVGDLITSSVPSNPLLRIIASSFFASYLNLRFVILIAGQSAALALLFAPVSLVVRWLIFRQTRVPGATGGALQSRP